MNDLNSSLSNIQFLNVCHYLSTFSIFFASIDLMTIDDQNQSVPVINALFEYLGKSPNESEAKNQLLQKVLIEFNADGKENKTLDMKYVNETYQYIIATLFDYENITRYLMRINQPRNVKSSFQKLHKINYNDLLKYNIRNVCSTKNGSKNLSSIAIGKILSEYILPFMQRSAISEEENKLEQKRVKEMAPQDIDIDNANQTETFKTLELLLHEAEPVQIGAELGPEGLDNFDESGNFLNSDEENNAEFFHDNSNVLDDIGLLDHEREFNDIPPNREADDGSDNFEDLLNFANFDDGNGAELFNSILKGDDDSEFLYNEREINDFPPVVDNRPDSIGDFLNSNEGNELEFVGKTLNDAEGVRQLVNEELNSSEPQIQGSLEPQEAIHKNPEVITITPKKHKLDHDTNIPVKIQRIDNGNNNPIINLNLADEEAILSDEPSTSKKARASMNFLHQEPTNDHGISKRLKYIKNAAKYLSSCVSYMSLKNAVDMLKGFLLKLENSTTPVPTYDDYVYDYCHNSEKLANYDIWRIPNDKFIDDVLFETYFDRMDTFDEIRIKMKPVTNRTNKIVHDDYKIYKNSPILKQSMRVEDFLLLKLSLQNDLNVRLSPAKKRMKASFYRLALRQCEEEWVENDITLFGVQNGQAIYNLKYNNNNYTFNYLIEFSTDREKEESKFTEPVNIKYKLVKYEIEFENLAGIVSVDRIFGANTTERFVIPLDTTLPLIYSGPAFIDNKKIFLFKMQDNRSKEKKMVDMVTKLYDILKDPDELFSHYN